MRPAKFPAAFSVRSLTVVLELTKAAFTIPDVTMGTAAPLPPDGQPEPSGLHPLAKFCCMARNDGRIPSELIWFRSYARSKRSPGCPTYAACATNPKGSSRVTLKLHCE